MLLSAVSVLVVAQSSSEIPEGLMNNPVFICFSDDTSWPFQNCRLLTDSESKYVFCDHQYMYMTQAFKYKLEKNVIFTGIHVNEYLLQRMK